MKTRAANRQRDPISEQEARRRGLPLLRAAERGDIEAAHVLLDVLQYFPGASGPPDVVTSSRSYVVHQLAAALQGRTFPAGDLLSDAASRARNLKNVLEYVRIQFFPARRRPCMPNRKELQNLHRQVRGDDRRGFQSLWNELQQACNSTSLRRVYDAMEFADEVLDGHGVEDVALATRRGGTRRAVYIEMGDTYNTTLAYDREVDRFLVTTWGDIVEGWERRFGRSGEEPEDEWW